MIVDRIFKATRAVANLVNPLDKTESTVREILIPPQTVKLLVQTGARLGEKGLTVGSLGEISLRVPGKQNKFVINTRGSEAGNLTGKDLCLMDTALGKTAGMQLAAAHSEWHKLVYTLTDANSALLCQPPYSLMCAMRGRCPDAALWPEIQPIPSLLDCASNNDQEIAEKLKNYRHLLVQEVGLLVTGNSLTELLWNAEIIERFCQISVLN